MSSETHDESRHFADEAADRYLHSQPPSKSGGPEPAGADDDADPPLLRATMYHLEEGEIHGYTIAKAIDLARRIGSWQTGGEEILSLSPLDRERLVERLLPYWGGPRHCANETDGDRIPFANGDGREKSVSSDPNDEFRQGVSPSTRLNRLAAGQPLAPSPAALMSVRRETAVTDLDLSCALDTRRPINPADALKIRGVLAATQTDLEGLAVQGLAASARANTGFGDLVGRAVETLVSGTKNAFDSLAAGALLRTFESETRVQRGAMTDGKGRVIAPATEEHSHFREQENFPAKTTLTAGGGTAQITGARVSLHSGFKAAAAALTGWRGRVDPDARVSVRAGDNYAEASGYGDSVVAAAGGAHVEISAPSATITVGPTTISRG